MGEGDGNQVRVAGVPAARIAADVTRECGASSKCSIWSGVIGESRAVAFRRPRHCL
jgi:hypothetical protein